jgi:6-phosphogluconolactonase
MKSVEVRKAVNALDVATQATDEILQTLQEVIHAKGSAHIALTGGTVGILTLEVLAKALPTSQVDVSKIHFWWGDERFVASDSADRNANQARVALLDSLDIAPDHLHEFPSTDGNLDLQVAKGQFAAHIKAVFGESEPRMDLTILGMGPDGHVASLFPGEQHEKELIVSVSDSPKPPAQRLSFSMDLINQSEKILFVVAGIDKAEAVEKVHKNPECELPAAQVSARGETLWLVDEAAGAAFWSC